MHRLTDQTARLIPALSDRYRIEGELGHAEMALVYLVHDVRNDRKVALKMLHTSVGAAFGAVPARDPGAVAPQPSRKALRPTIMAAVGIAHAITSSDDEKPTKMGVTLGTLLTDNGYDALSRLPDMRSGRGRRVRRQLVSGRRVEDDHPLERLRTKSQTNAPGRQTRAHRCCRVRGLRVRPRSVPDGA
jgi:hypothetical protein